jgi:hypothetical protein
VVQVRTTGSTSTGDTGSTLVPISAPVPVLLRCSQVLPVVVLVLVPGTGTPLLLGAPYCPTSSQVTINTYLHGHTIYVHMSTSITAESAHDRPTVRPPSPLPRLPPEHSVCPFWCCYAAAATAVAEDGEATNTKFCNTFEGGNQCHSHQLRKLHPHLK